MQPEVMLVAASSRSYYTGWGLDNERSMRISLAIAISLTLPAHGAPTGKAKPALVAAALEAYDACEHWSEEMGDQSDERNAEILAGMARDCPEAGKKAAKALKLHPNDPDLAEAALALANDNHLSLTKAERVRLCRLTLPTYKRLFARSKEPNDGFILRCPEVAQRLYGKHVVEIP